MIDYNEVFEQWAPTYDATVAAQEGEYAEVFWGYEDILKAVAEEIPRGVPGMVIDIGSGTGNLVKVASTFDYPVIGVEPVAAMRAIAMQKYPHITFIEGDFLHVNLPSEIQVRSFISSYALHHLTDYEKKQAINYLRQYLPPGGRIIIADTMFERDMDKELLIQEVRSTGCLSLAKDLEAEYYTTVGYLVDQFKEAGFIVKKVRQNRYVWLLVAQKG